MAYARAHEQLDHSILRVRALARHRLLGRRWTHRHTLCLGVAVMATATTGKEDWVLAQPLPCSIEGCTEQRAHWVYEVHLTGERFGVCWDHIREQPQVIQLLSQPWDTPQGQRLLKGIQL